ncbi:MAG: Lipopolysaccharide assembly protein A [Anaerolineales bacterium]|nr:Lipopolysaccharide assembly protein A [Anaerolineales bacterium]
MSIVYLILALLIAVVAVIFAWQNSIVVSLAFFSMKIEDAPLSLVIIATLLIGIIIGWLFAAPSLVKNSFRASGNRKRIGALEKELEDHKTKLNEMHKPASSTPPSQPKPAEPKPVTPLPSKTKSDTDPLSHS